MCVSAVGSGLFLLTALSQHPNRAFDRLRSFDKIGFAIPNWRFFAPEPAMHDFHILHRTLDARERESPWQESHQVTPRRLGHIVWFPNRRRDKALFDVVSEIAGLLGQSEDIVLASPAYRLLSSFVRSKIEQSGHQELAGFQFLLARSTGYDSSQAPEEILSSPFILWKEHDEI